MTETTQDLPWFNQVEKIAEDVATREGCLLYDLEFVGVGKGRTLRVYIDKENGVGIDDCSNVSKALNLLLDVEDLIPGGAYNLEVSTPGIDRHLKKAWHFEKAVGKKIWVKTKEAFEKFGAQHGRWTKAKQIEADLSEVNESCLVFKTADETLKIPLNAVEKSKVIFEMSKGQKK